MDAALASLGDTHDYVDARTLIAAHAHTLLLAPRVDVSSLCEPLRAALHAARAETALWRPGSPPFQSDAHQLAVLTLVDPSILAAWHVGCPAWMSAFGTGLWWTARGRRVWFAVHGLALYVHRGKGLKMRTRHGVTRVPWPALWNPRCIPPPLAVFHLCAAQQARDAARDDTPLRVLLRDAHPHVKDMHVSFRDEGHAYTVHADPEHTYTSTTTAIAEFHAEFDAVAVAAKCVSREGGRYYGLDPADVVRVWDEHREEASTLGSAMHNMLELRMNGLHEPWAGKELAMFQAWEATWPASWVPWRTEMLVYDPEFHITGAIDLLLRDVSTGNFVIVDYKRSKEIKYAAFRRQRMFPPLDGLQDCNYSHYLMQQSMYAYILSTHYGMAVDRIMLLVLHPDQDTYLCVPIKPRFDLVRAMLQDRHTP